MIVTTQAAGRASTLPKSPYSIEEAMPMHKWMFPLALVFIVALQCNAQDKIDLFAGYSYVRGSTEVRPTAPSTPCPPNCTPPSLRTQGSNLNSWGAAGVYKFNRVFGLAGDFGGQYGALNGSSVHLYSYLVGPQLSLPGRVSPFVHGLVGGAHESVGTFPNFAFSSLGSDSGLAFAVGGGIDMKATRLISMRLIQVDFLQTHLYGHVQNQPRISAGLVFHF
jgi:hypothetical protein